MNVHTTIDHKWSALAHPNGSPIRLNHQDFVAIDRDRTASYEATYRPQALYNRANEGFHANNESFLLHEVATNLPIICRTRVRPISISTCHRAATSSCWLRQECSPSTTTAGFTMSAPAR